MSDSVFKGCPKCGKRQRTHAQVLDIMDLYSCSEHIAHRIMESYDAGFEVGRKTGQAEAQRFLRLSLGLEEPDEQERAYWSNPIPLKEKTP